MKVLRLALFALLAILAPQLALAQAPPPVPALPDTERRTAYSLTASTCNCAVNFALYGDSTDYWDWVEVYINGVLTPYNSATAPWTITSPTGPLASIPRPVTDAQLTFGQSVTGTIQIVGARRPRRVSQFTESRGVPARDLNQALTDIIAQNRETWDKINDVTGRGLFSQPGNTVGPLPLPLQCESAYLVFDATGLNPECAAIVSTTIATGLGVQQALEQAVNAANGMAVLNANGTLAETNPNPAAPAFTGIGSGTNLTAVNQVGLFSNNGERPTDFSSIVPYDVVAGVLVMREGNTPVIQYDTIGGYIQNYSPTGPAASVSNVSSYTLTFSFIAGQTALPNTLAAGQYIFDSTTNALVPGLISSITTNTVTMTQSASAAVVATGGACTPDGAYTFNSSAGTGSSLLLSGTVTSGALAGALTIPYGAAGSYTAFPSNPVTLTALSGGTCGTPPTVTLTKAAIGVTNGDVVAFDAGEQAGAGWGAGNAVGLYSNVTCQVSQQTCFGANPLVSNLPGAFSGNTYVGNRFANLVGMEIDLDNQQQLSSGNALSLTGASTSGGSTSLTSYNGKGYSALAIQLMDQGQPSAPRATWGAGVYMQNGCCGTAMFVPALSSIPVANSGSAEIIYQYFDGSSAEHGFQSYVIQAGDKLDSCDASACSFLYGGTLPSLSFQAAPGVFDQVVLDNAHAVSLSAGSAITSLGIGNTTANVTVFAPNLILTNNMEMNNAAQITIDADAMLANTGHAAGVATGASITSVSIGVSGASLSLPSTSITAAGLPASAGTGGVYVCVDTTGKLYKKAACP